jgi:hypothetical protein
VRAGGVALKIGGVGDVLVGFTTFNDLATAGDRALKLNSFFFCDDIDGVDSFTSGGREDFSGSHGSTDSNIS